MKFLIILVIAAVGVADRLDHVHLPPNAGSSGGPAAGLLTPLGGHYNHGDDHNNAAAHAEILRYENDINEEGYHYAYETSDGIKAEQQGRVIPGPKPEEGSLKVTGSYSYVGEDGQTYTVTYTADENGYHAEGAHLPTPPPIPEEILKSLQLTNTRSDQYSSRKSSYDADAGY